MIFHIEIMPLCLIIAIIFRIQVQFALLRQLIYVVDITLCNRLRLLVFLQNLSCHLRRYQSWLAPYHRRIRPAYFHHFNVIILGFIIVGGLPILFQSSLVYPAYLLSILTIFVHWKFLLSSGICLCILFSLSLLLKSLAILSHYLFLASSTILLLNSLTNLLFFTFFIPYFLSASHPFLIKTFHSSPELVNS